MLGKMSGGRSSPAGELLGGEKALRPEERAVYEKILASFYAEEETGFRLRQEQFLSLLLSPEERETEALLVLEFLQGSSGEFAEFLRRRLGFTSREVAHRALREKYGEVMEERIRRFRETGR
jgi:hypothetical protein